jgi:succinate dehydrogenase / fumarate reductase flavoprotein subunit
MQSAMTQEVGVFRTEEGISRAIAVLRNLKEQANDVELAGKALVMNPELMQRWELDNLLASAMVIAHSALNRRDSRGGHYREDHPERSPEHNDHTLAYMELFGEVRLEKRPVDMSLWEARGPNHEKFGMIERKY